MVKKVNVTLKDSHFWTQMKEKTIMSKSQIMQNISFRALGNMRDASCQNQLTGQVSGLRIGNVVNLFGKATNSNELLTLCYAWRPGINCISPHLQQEQVERQQYTNHSLFSEWSGLMLGGTSTLHVACCPLFITSFTTNWYDTSWKLMIYVSGRYIIKIQSFTSIFQENILCNAKV